IPVELGHLPGERIADEIGAEIVDGVDPLARFRRRDQTGIDHLTPVSGEPREKFCRARGPQFEERLARRSEDRLDLFDNGTKRLEMPRRLCRCGGDFGIDLCVAEGWAV